MAAGKAKTPVKKDRPDTGAAKKDNGAAGRGDASASRKIFPVVGIGASAGGLEAVATLFSAMPDELPDVAFVVISHLDPKHSSILSELLQKHTWMQVVQAEEGMAVLPREVYVIPPNRNLKIEDNVLKLVPFIKSSTPKAPVDYFFRSLARQAGEMAIGIVLSGMGSDGTNGIKAIKDEFGLVMVQTPDSAKYDSMPKSALATGLVDFVLQPEDMPGQVVDHINRLLNGNHDPAGMISVDALKMIHSILRNRTGHDFSHYKESTVRRRIIRRMNILGVEKASQYIRHLQKNDDEAPFLIKGLLIGVTRFFRDGDAFESFRKNAVPRLFENRGHQRSLRVWVAGCATGEEAYTIGIILREYIEEHQLDIDLKIFATDLDDEAVTMARAGLFPAGIAEDVPPEYLKKHFKKEGGGYRISAGIRESIIFARQSLIKDPPFTRLDLISCRNLLIYLDVEIQARLLPLFHYSLNPGGILFLGSSETIGQYTGLYSVVESHQKIFQKKPDTNADLLPLSFPFSHLQYKAEHPVARKQKDITTLAERALLDHYTPPSVIIDEKGEIHYIHGRIGKYLDYPQGPVSTYNIFAMAREELKLYLTSTLRHMKPGAGTIENDVTIDRDGKPIHIRVTLSPFQNGDSGRLYLAVFRELPENTPGRQKEKAEDRPAEGKTRQTADLQKELQACREKLSSTMEELESSNEELRSSNEEYQATNEELQSANEELSSSKEELQSLNEELETLNSELQAKVRQVENAYDEMSKMLNSLGMPTIFLDDKLCIRRFSSNTESIADLIETDVGRPLKHLSSKLADVDLDEAARQVIGSMRHVEMEVRTRSGHWYLMRVLPYPGLDDNRGVVLTFLDIGELKLASARLQASEDALTVAEGIIATVREPLVVLDGDLKVVSASERFYRVFDAARADVEQRSFLEMNGGQWDAPELRALLDDVLLKNKSFDDFDLERDFRGIGRRKMRLNARRILEQGTAGVRILLAIEDITQRTTNV